MASILTVDNPGWRSLQLEVLLLDVNGTLTLDGELLAGVDAGLKALIQSRLACCTCIGTRFIWPSTPREPTGTLRMS